MVAYTTRNATNRNLFLKYNRHGGNVHGADHYSPIVDKVMHAITLVLILMNTIKIAD